MGDDGVDDGAQIFMTELHHINLHLRSFLVVDNQEIDMPYPFDDNGALVNCDALNGSVWHVAYCKWYITLADAVHGQLYSDGPEYEYWQHQES
ncbi:MAG: hypothetical protein ACXWP6_04705 [Ktedonobacterales bacterium]